MEDGLTGLHGGIVTRNVTEVSGVVPESVTTQSLSTAAGTAEGDQ